MVRSLADKYSYRGVEYMVFEHTPGEWEWLYFPKVLEGVVTRGQVKGRRCDAIAASKAAIDKLLGPKTE
jgi:hypothetical protein